MIDCVHPVVFQTTAPMAHPYAWANWFAWVADMGCFSSTAATHWHMPTTVATATAHPYCETF
jgi:hypothetical protein